ncbi:MAG: hypothetical protein ACI9VM_000212 [Candidatus Azotimanducaceae bacterium]|jgi:hypothetical protein
MDVYSLLVIGHLIGTILGVGGATFIEVHLNKALADGTMSEDERGMLGLDFVVLRIGLVLAVFTGVGFIILYIVNGQEFRLQNPVFWAKMAMVLIVAVNALLLQSHKISLYWGSALSFITWWGAMILGFFLTGGIRYGFIEIMVVYGVIIVAGAYVLHKIREYIKKKHV